MDSLENYMWAWEIGNIIYGKQQMQYWLYNTPHLPLPTWNNEFIKQGMEVVVERNNRHLIITIELWLN